MVTQNGLGNRPGHTLPAPDAATIRPYLSLSSRALAALIERYRLWNYELERRITRDINPATDHELRDHIRGELHILAAEAHRRDVDAGVRR